MGVDKLQPEDVSVLDILRQAEADLDAMRADLEADQAAIADKEARVSAQASLVNNLRIALDRYVSGTPIATGPTENPEAIAAESWWKTAPRTQAIVRALREMAYPAGPSAIAEFLNRQGRPQDNPILVSASLNHLSNTGKVSSLGHGQWVVSPDKSAMDQLVATGDYRGAPLADRSRTWGDRLGRPDPTRSLSIGRLVPPSGGPSLRSCGSGAL